MKTSRRISWIAAGILTVLLTTTFFAAQKSQTSDVLFKRAIQKEQVDGDKKAAIELYRQVIAAPGVSQKLKSQAQDHLAVLLASSAPIQLVDRRICTDCGGHNNPVSISRDGRILAFGVPTALNNGGTGLSIRDLASGQVAPLLSDAVLAPVISPDGKQIAYSGTSKAGACFCPADDAPGVYDLRIVANELGAIPRVLKSNPEWNVVTPAAWSLDGKYILAVVAKRVDRTWMMVWISTSDGTVTQLKSLGWRFSCCGPMGLPSLSPDGRTIAYAARVSDQPPGAAGGPDSNDVHIYLLSADNSTPEIKLVKGASVNEGPIWMPDGKNLLFVSNRAGSFGLWSVAIQGGALRPVRPDAGEIHTMGMTQSGSYFYSRSPQAGLPHLLVSEAGTTAQAEDRHALDAIVGTSPSWSPDGKLIAFIRPGKSSPDGKGGSTPGANTLMIYSLDTKDETRYIPGDNMSVSTNTPHWFHDGSALLQEIRDPKGVRSLYRVDLKTSQFNHITSAVASYVISSDEKTIYVSEPGEAAPLGTCQMDRIVAADSGNGQRRTVAVIPKTKSPLILSPDDKTLYMEPCDQVIPMSQSLPNSTSGSVDSASHHIVAVDVTTGQQREVFAVKSPEVMSGVIDLSADGHMLAATIDPSVSYDAFRNPPPNEAERLIRIGVDGNNYHELFRFSAGMILIQSWAANGTSVIVDTLRIQSGRAQSGSLRIPVNGGNPEVIPSPERAYLSPDGSRKITRIQANGEELMALDNVLAFLKTTP